MIASLLIANRGEIACRIIRTCRRLGIRPIAVFSEADADALHVRLADAKYCIGPAEASRSYLRADAIIEAALAHGAAAIHPGYGFLSEKVELAKLCQQHNIIWVGPSPHCIAAMGSKIESKLIAERAGVVGVPGYHGADQSPKRLLEEARRIGFPILIKASAGGGGKGMRRVDDAGDFAATLDTVRREAKSAFGDDGVLLEKLIKRPRHLEVQLAGDKHGNVLHLFERECSIQRNYQKVVEEAPAANLPASAREKLLAAAVRLGNAVKYDSLGTVEFIADADDPEPYFLEMNTRLQVEHPVTELVTGLDLVELQLRIATGQKLPFAQSDITVNGSAIEVRVNAENPAESYRPNVGRIGLYKEPNLEGVRIDSGVAAGSEVTPYYDSMLAKVIAHGPDRETATQRLAAALDQMVILGVGTNQMFLRDIIRAPQFRDEVLTTRFIGETFPTGWSAPEPDERHYAAAAVAAALDQPRGSLAKTAPESPWARLAGFRVIASAGCPGRSKFQVRNADHPPVVADLIPNARAFRVEIDGRPLDDLELVPAPDGTRITARKGPVLASFECLIDADRVDLFEPGRGIFAFEVLPLVKALANSVKGGKGADTSDIVATMPGLITEVPVTVGQYLRRGETAVVMEAMKLVLPLAAPVDGAVRAINCAAGQTVTGGTRLVEFEPGKPQDQR